MTNSTQNYRKICFKMNKDDGSFDKFERIYNDNKDLIRYLIIGDEISETGYPHWQGYVQMFRQHKMRSIKILFEDFKIHIEEQCGNNIQARNYCWKGNKKKKGTDLPQDDAIYKEYGIFCKGQGIRNDLEIIKRDIENDMEHVDIVKDNKKFASYARYHSWFFKYKQMCDDIKHNKMREPLKVINIFGDTGTGKTQSILNKYDCKNCYILQNSQGDNKSWNGYTNQKILIIDDFYGWIKLNEMLRLLDNKPYRVRKLNGYCWAQWETVFITSNIRCEDWFPNVLNQKVLDALYSRISKCIKVTKGNTGALVTKIIKSKSNRHNQLEYFVLKDKYLVDRIMIEKIEDKSQSENDCSSINSERCSEHSINTKRIMDNEKEGLCFFSNETNSIEKRDDSLRPPLRYGHSFSYLKAVDSCGKNEFI